MPAQAAGSWIEDLLEQHEKKLRHYVFKMLRDEELAADVVQDAFCRLCRQNRAAVQGHETEWLYTVCRNRALDELRKRRRTRPMNDVISDSHRSSEIDPADQVEHQDAVAALLQAMDKLPEREQEILRLKFQQGLSYRQISQITGDSVSNVGYLIHQGLQILRRRMQRGSPVAAQGRNNP